MFAWLADLLVKSSVIGTGSCCCEGSKEQLKKMQQAVLQGKIENDVAEKPVCSCQWIEEAGNRVENREELRTSYRYQI